MNPAVLSQPPELQPFSLNVPPVTVPRRKPWKRPVTPTRISLPWWVPPSQAPGLVGPKVVNLPLVKSSRTAKDPSALGETVKERLKVSVAQSGPQVPESGDPLGKGPKSAALSSLSPPWLSTPPSPSSARAGVTERKDKCEQGNRENQPPLHGALLLVNSWSAARILLRAQHLDDTRPGCPTARDQRRSHRDGHPKHQDGDQLERAECGIGGWRRVVAGRAADEVEKDAIERHSQWGRHQPTYQSQEAG